jgi:hypothetical protein
VPLWCPRLRLRPSRATTALATGEWAHEVPCSHFGTVGCGQGPGPGAAGAESILVQGPWYRSAVAFASSGAPGVPHAFEESRMVVMAADQMHIPLSYGPEWL